MSIDIPLNCSLDPMKLNVVNVNCSYDLEFHVHRVCLTTLITSLAEAVTVCTANGLDVV